MSTQSLNNMTPGRMALTARSSRVAGVPPNTWSVLACNPYKASLQQWQASGRAGNKPSGDGKVVDVYFFPSKSDAWEESAFLCDKRADEDAETTSARRNRTYNGMGILKCITIHACSSMGIGNPVEGVRNVEGTRIEDEGNGGDLLVTSLDKAQAALNKFQPTFVSAVTNKWQVTNADGLSLTKAKIVSVDGDVAEAEYYAKDGTPAGKIKFPLQDAAQLFEQVGGTHIAAVESDDWPMITPWASLRGALKSGIGGPNGSTRQGDKTFILGIFILRLDVALGRLKEDEINSLRADPTGKMESCLNACLNSINIKIGYVENAADVIRSLGSFPSYEKIAEAILNP